MLSYMYLIVCACAVSQVLGYTQPLVTNTSPIGAYQWKLQPSATVEYLVPAQPYGASTSYGSSVPAYPSSGYDAPISAYPAPAYQPAPAYPSPAYPAPAPAPAPVQAYGSAVPAPYGPAPRAPAIDGESVNYANFALSLPSAGGPIVDPIPVAQSSQTVY